MENKYNINAIAKFWNQNSEGFDEEHNTEDLAMWSDSLEKIIGLKGKGRILDVGTGTGFLAILLAKLGYEVVGIDFAQKMMDIGIEKAEKLHLPVEFVHSEGEKLTFETGSFDAVVNCRVMWTLTDPVEALGEWKRVIKNEGRIISFMRMMEITEDSVKDYYGDGVELPLRKAGRDEYVKTYKDAGLKDITTIELPEEMSHADMPGWTAFIGTNR